MSAGPGSGRVSTSPSVVVIALGGVALELATGWRDGLFRDELYDLACASRLDWGYVDHPPLSIVVLAGVRALLGDSLLAVRLVPALLLGSLVWLAAQLARHLGGDRFAEALAALSVAIAPHHLGIAGLYSMNVFDLVLWALAALLVARLVASDDARLWIPLGVVVGLGLMNKLTMLVFAFGLGVAVIATPLRRHLATYSLWVGALVALALVAPYIVWNVRHDGATLEFIRNATRYKNVPISPLAFALAQVTAMHPFNTPLWLAGAAWLTIGRAGRPGRALGIVFVVTFATLALAHGKPYYLAPAFTIALAGGAVAIERTSDAPRWRRCRPVALAVLAVGGAVSAPLAIPVLPVDALIRYQRALGVMPVAAERSRLGPLPQHFADRFGWHDLTAEVAWIYDALPAAERGAVVLLARNYGETAGDQPAHQLLLLGTRPRSRVGRHRGRLGSRGSPYVVRPRRGGRTRRLAVRDALRDALADARLP